ncbi:MAG: hypothetical protein ACREJQ_01960 [bacterium]
MVSGRGIVAFTLYLGVTLLLMTFIFRGRKITNPQEAVILFFGVLILAIFGFVVVYWNYFITADFFEMPPIRLTRDYMKWLATKLRGEKRLAQLPGSMIQIPAPFGDEDLRDLELESLIRKKQLKEADEHLREQLEFYRIKGGPDAEMRFNAYTQYLHFMINFRRQLEKV